MMKVDAICDFNSKMVRLRDLHDDRPTNLDNISIPKWYD